jgi:alginate O-acetyltransferase complex protein AlgI
MVFSSGIFLFVFLPVFLGLYYLTPFKFRSFLILLGSYVFYAWWRIDFLVLLAGITIVAYWFALQIEKAQDVRVKFRLLSFAVGLNLLALAYFKYANFGVNSFNSILEKLGFHAVSWTPVILPIGLSFFIFHAISYLVDIYRHEARPTQNIIDFAAFIALFPHLIAGPVLRYHLLAEQFRARVHSWERFSRGATRFMLGFTKKVLLADTIAPLSDAAFLLSHPTFLDAWLGALAYTMQIFFDFSGYSDMAIGLALMMGFEFPENFWHPYASRSITEFWRRWHMSLSSWLREYLYIPLGGNRYGTARTYFNLTTTMVLGGLWHGANWTFIIWGAWHGGILALERALKGRRKPFSAWLTIPGTMLLVVIGWVFFRSENFEGATRVLKGMFGLNGFSISDALAFQITGLEITALIAAFVASYAGVWWASREKTARMTWGLWLIPMLFIIALSRMLSQSFSPFLYFQF